MVSFTSNVYIFSFLDMQADGFYCCNFRFFKDMFPVWKTMAISFPLALKTRELFCPRKILQEVHVNVS